MGDPSPPPPLSTEVAIKELEVFSGELTAHFVVKKKRNSPLHNVCLTLNIGLAGTALFPGLPTVHCLQYVKTERKGLVYFYHVNDVSHIPPMVYNLHSQHQNNLLTWL